MENAITRAFKLPNREVVKQAKVVPVLRLDKMGKTIRDGFELPNMKPLTTRGNTTLVSEM
jgi:hypothetical protein